eukprot:TRINITY_DN2615_c0_g1_i1.p1 TRINITY_DN2615_c0_g1~~TRINITY_DN2615_c0_g1_i1.p1  ORF type:complete len:1580 (+),score=343.57 TRINITY_DN2615_c0_g1_i1:87-4742(+)
MASSSQFSHSFLTSHSERRVGVATTTEEAQHWYPVEIGVSSSTESVLRSVRPPTPTFQPGAIEHLNTLSTAQVAVTARRTAEELRETLERESRARSAAERQCLELQQQLKGMYQAMDSRLGDCQAHSSRIHALQATCDAKTLEVEELQRQLREARSSRRAEQARHENELNHANLERSEESAKTAAALEELHRERDRNNRLQAELALIQAHATANAGRDAEALQLREQLASLRAELEDRAAKVSALSQTNNKLARQTAAQAAQLKELERLQSERRVESEEAAALQTQARTLEEQLRGLQTKLTVALAEVRQAQEQKAKLHSDCEKAKTEAQHWREKYFQEQGEAWDDRSRRERLNSEKTVENTVLRTQLQEKQKECDAFSMHVQTVQTEFEKTKVILEQWKIEVERERELRRQEQEQHGIERLRSQAEIARLQTELEFARSQASLHERSADERRSEKQELTETLHRLQAETQDTSASFARQRAELEAEANGAKARLQEYQSELQATVSRLSSTKAALVEAHSRIEDLEKIRVELENSCTRFEERLRLTTEELQQVRACRDLSESNFLREISALRSSADDLRSALAQAEQRENNLDEMLHEARKEGERKLSEHIAEGNDRVAALQQQLEDTRTQCRALKQRNETLDAELQLARLRQAEDLETRTSLESTISTLNVEISSRVTEISRLKEEILHLTVTHEKERKETAERHTDALRLCAQQGQERVEVLSREQEGERRAHQQEVRNLQLQQIESNQSALDARRQLEEELSKVRTQAQALLGDVADLTTRTHKAEEALQRSQAERDLANQKLAALTGENAEMSFRILQLQQAERSALDRCRTFQQQLEQVMTRESTTTIERSDLQREVEHLRREIELVLSEQSAAKEGYHRAHSELQLHESQLRDQVKSLLAENAELTNEVAAARIAQQHAAFQQERLITVERQLEERTREQVEVSSSAERLNSLAKRLEQNLADKTAECESYRVALQIASTKTREKETEWQTRIDILEQQRINLTDQRQTEVHRLSLETQRLQSELSEQRQRAEFHQRQCEQLLARSEADEAASVAALRTQLEVANLERQGLEVQIRQYHEKFSTLDAECVRLKFDIAEREREAAGARATADARAREVDDLRRQAARQAEQLIANSGERRDEVSRLMQRIDVLESENRNLSQKLLAEEQRESERSALRQRLRKERDELQEQSTKALEENAALQRTISELNRSIGEQRLRIQEIEHREQERNQSVASSSQLLKRRDEEIGALTSKLESETLARAELQQHLSEQSERLTTLQKERARIGTELELRGSEMAKNQQAVAELQAEVARLRASQANLESLARSLEQTLGDERAAHRTALDRETELRKQLETTQVEGRSASQSHAERLRQLEDALMQEKRLNAENQRRDELATAKHSQALSELRATLEGRAAGITTECKQLHAFLATLLEQIRELVNSHEDGRVLLENSRSYVHERFGEGGSAESANDKMQMHFSQAIAVLSTLLQQYRVHSRPERHNVFTCDGSTHRTITVHRESQLMSSYGTRSSGTLAHVLALGTTGSK